MSTHAVNPPRQRLENFPVMFFAVIMGLTGLTLSFDAASVSYPSLASVSPVLLWISTLSFVAVSLIYLAKCFLHFGHLKAEWHHPVRLSFFPAISISTLLLCLAWYGQVGTAIVPFFLFSVALQIVLTLSVISGWIGSRSFQHGQLSPAWFIPAVGNVLVPLVGVPLGYVDLSWFFFALGIVFWIVLLTLVVNRLIFHDPLPDKLQPTLVILIAPPAIGFLAWMALVGGLDPFGRILINAAYVFALIVAVQLPRITKLDFAMSFWALSFPIAALTVASFRYSLAVQSTMFASIGVFLLVFLSALIVWLIWNTTKAAFAGKICIPE